MPNIPYKHFIYDHELMLYPYAPLGLLHNQGEWPEPIYSLSIVASVSIKDLNIVEWITYHQTLGVDHIYLYCTDEDPTDLYRKIAPFTLGKNPFITFHHYRFSQSFTPHYFHFIRNYIHETKWYLNLDINDYLYMNENQTLSNFIQSFADLHINAVYFNIVLYNNETAGNSENTQTVFQQTTPINYPCIYTKLMVRSRNCPYQYIFENLGIKIDHHIQADKLVHHSCNVLKQDMKAYYENFPYSALRLFNPNIQNEVINTAYIAHFCKQNDIQKNIEDISGGKADLDILSAYHDNSYYTPSNHCTPYSYWKKTLKNAWKASLLPAPLPLLSLVSHNKSCQQSSAPDTMRTEDLAYNLANGQLQGITQTITRKETNPWWEIDLEQSYIVKTIRLFNGIDPHITNMIHFIIESSEDHETWIQRHQKNTQKFFGGADGTYYNWIHPLGIKARWIRITVPGENKVFSLDQIQILGIEYNNYYIP